MLPTKQRQQPVSPSSLTSSACSSSLPQPRVCSAPAVSLQRRCLSQHRATYCPTECIRRKLTRQTAASFCQLPNSFIKLITIQGTVQTAVLRVRTARRFITTPTFRTITSSQALNSLSRANGLVTLKWEKVKRRCEPTRRHNPHDYHVNGLKRFKILVPNPLGRARTCPLTRQDALFC
jgi:hypothetical protein